MRAASAMRATEWQHSWKSWSPMSPICSSFTPATMSSSRSGPTEMFVHNRRPTLAHRLRRRGTRIGAAFHRLLAVRENGAPWNNFPTDFETVLDNTIGPTSYVRDDDLRKKIVGHYELSLDRMVTLARSAGAEIVFVRPACKLLHCSPFKSVPSDQFAGRKTLLWHQQLEQGQSHLRDGDYRQGARGA